MMLVRNQRSLKTAKTNTMQFSAPKTVDKKTYNLCPGWTLSSLSDIASKLVKTEALKRLVDHFSLWIFLRIRWKQRQAQGLAANLDPPSILYKRFFKLMRFSDDSFIGLIKTAVPLVYQNRQLILYPGEKNPPGIYILTSGKVKLTSTRGFKYRFCNAPLVVGEANFLAFDSQESVSVFSDTAEVFLIPGKVIISHMNNLTREVKDSISSLILQYRTSTIPVQFPMTPQIIQTSPVLRGFDNKILQSVCRVLVPKSEPPGVTLFHPNPSVVVQGREAEILNDKIIFLRSGTCAIQLQLGDQIVVLSWIKAPSTIGEGIMLKYGTAQWITTVTECDTWVLRLPELIRVIDSSSADRNDLFKASSITRCSWMDPHLQPSLLRVTPLYRKVLSLGILKESDFLNICRLFKPIVFPPGSFITTVSYPCQECVIFEKGRATVCYNTVTRRIGKGECLSSGMLVPSKWISTINARSNCDCWFLRRDDLSTFLLSIDDGKTYNRFYSLSKQLCKEETLLLSRHRYGPLGGDADLFFPVSTSMSAVYYSEKFSITKKQEQTMSTRPAGKTTPPTGKYYKGVMKARAVNILTKSVLSPSEILTNRLDNVLKNHTKAVDDVLQGNLKSVVPGSYAQPPAEEEEEPKLLVTRHRTTFFVVMKPEVPPVLALFQSFARLGSQDVSGGGKENELKSEDLSPLKNDNLSSVSCFNDWSTQHNFPFTDTCSFSSSEPPRLLCPLNSSCDIASSFAVVKSSPSAIFTDSLYRRTTTSAFVRKVLQRRGKHEDEKIFPGQLSTFPVFD